MPEYPYTPRTATVGDVEQRQSVKPQSIRRAIVCLWISAALAGIHTLLDFAATGVISVVILALIAVKVGSRRRWARELFAVLYIFGILGVAISLFLLFINPEMFQSYTSLPLLNQLSALVQFALQTSALIFLFTRASTEWFWQSEYVDSRVQ